MIGRALLISAVSFLLAFTALADDQPAVRVHSMDQVGPRPVEEQTQKSIVRDYLAAWQSMSKALSTNRANLLNDSFIGTAREKLGETVREQAGSGMQTAYRDRSHNLQVLFYSAEGLSIQLSDLVEYDVEIREHDKVIGTQHVRTNYIAVLTPTESKWKVRLFQARPE